MLYTVQTETLANLANCLQFAKVFFAIFLHRHVSEHIVQNVDTEVLQACSKGHYFT